MQQLFPFALYQSGYRDSGPALHDLGDFLLRNPVSQDAALPGRGSLCLLGLKLFLKFRQSAKFQLRGFFQFIVLLCCFDLSVQIFQLLAQLLNIFNGLFLVFPLCLHGVEAVALFRQLLLKISQSGLGQVIFLFLQSGFFNLHLDDFPGYRIQFCGHGVHFCTDLSAGLIDQIDGLVREKTVCDIAVG